MRFIKVVFMWLLLLCVTLPLSAQPKQLVVAKHLTYTIVYDYSRMAPAVVFYNLNAADFTGNIKAKPRYFKMDTKLPKPRLSNDAFTFSGYQRGHLCPAGDRDSRKDWFRDTYYTSNILPMTAECNSGAWKEIESICRDLVRRGHPLSIACGPVSSWRPRESNTNSRISVPDSIWKIAVCRAHQNEVYFWKVPNDRQFRSAEICRQILPEDFVFSERDINKLIESWISQ